MDFSTLTVTIPPSSNLTKGEIVRRAFQEACQFFEDSDPKHYAMVIRAKSAGYGTTSAKVEVTYHDPSETKE